MRRGTSNFSSVLLPPSSVSVLFELCLYINYSVYQLFRRLFLLVCMYSCILRTYRATTTTSVLLVLSTPYQSCTIPTAVSQSAHLHKSSTPANYCKSLLKSLPKSLATPLLCSTKSHGVQSIRTATIHRNPRVPGSNKAEHSTEHTEYGVTRKHASGQLRRRYEYLDIRSLHIIRHSSILSFN